MKAKVVFLEKRKGNWVTVDIYGKAKPSTPSELFLWQRILDLHEQLVKKG
jgi:hypothetical protein